MKRIRARYLFPLFLLFLAACHHPSKSVGHEFVGKWVDIDSPSDSVVIARDGNKFVITDGIHALVATYDDGALAPNNGKGKCSYITVTDTMYCGLTNALGKPSQVLRVIYKYGFQTIAWSYTPETSSSEILSNIDVATQTA